MPVKYTNTISIPANHRIIDHLGIGHPLIVACSSPLKKTDKNFVQKSEKKLLEINSLTKQKNGHSEANTTQAKKQVQNKDYTSLVFGIIGLGLIIYAIVMLLSNVRIEMLLSFAVGLFAAIFSLIALILGITTLYKIHEHPDKLKGRGIALAGSILGIIGLIPIIILLIASLFP